MSRSGRGLRSHRRNSGRCEARCGSILRSRVSQRSTTRRSCRRRRRSFRNSTAKGGVAIERMQIGRGSIRSGSGPTLGSTRCTLQRSMRLSRIGTNFGEQNGSCSLVGLPGQLLRCGNGHRSGLCPSAECRNRRSGLPGRCRRSTRSNPHERSLRCVRNRAWVRSQRSGRELNGSRGRHPASSTSRTAKRLRGNPGQSEERVWQLQRRRRTQAAETTFVPSIVATRMAHTAHLRPTRTAPVNRSRLRPGVMSCHIESRWRLRGRDESGSACAGTRSCGHSRARGPSR